MTTEKRKRGRPLDSCIDDSSWLVEVADILLSNPKLKPTTAIKRVLPPPDPSPIRRLQSKWKQDGSVYLAQAQNRTKRKADEVIQMAMQRIQREMATATDVMRTGCVGSIFGDLPAHKRELMLSIEKARADAFRPASRLSMFGTTQEMSKLFGSSLLHDALTGLEPRFGLSAGIAYHDMLETLTRGATLRGTIKGSQSPDEKALRDVLKNTKRSLQRIMTFT